MPYENQQARFKTSFTLKMIYTVCSTKGAILLPFQWSTKSFQKEKTFHLECEKPVHFIVSKFYPQGTPRKKQHRRFFRGVHQSKNPKTRTQYIAKMLCRRSSMKEPISLLHPRSTLKFKKKKDFHTRTLGEY